MILYQGGQQPGQGNVAPANAAFPQNPNMILCQGGQQSGQGNVATANTAFSVNIHFTGAEMQMPQGNTPLQFQGTQQPQRPFGGQQRSHQSMGIFDDKIPEQEIAMRVQADPKGQDSEMFPGLKVVTRKTHRLDPEVGPVDKETGKAHINTLLTRNGGYVLSTDKPDDVGNVATMAGTAVKRKYGENARIPMVSSLVVYPPWDGHSDIPMNSRRSFGLPPSSKTPGYLNGRWLSADKRRRPGDPIRCGRCNKEGHTLGECVAWPARNIGDIYGCPLCNTKEHAFQDCYAVLGYADVAPMTEDDKFYYLIVKRQGKPMIRTDIVFEAETYAELAEKYEVTRPPLTRCFVMELMHQGLYSFKDYNYGDGTPPYPEDPDKEKAIEPTEQSFPLWKGNRINRPIIRLPINPPVGSGTKTVDEDVNMDISSGDPGQNPGNTDQMDQGDDGDHHLINQGNGGNGQLNDQGDDGDRHLIHQGEEQGEEDINAYPRTSLRGADDDEDIQANFDGTSQHQPT